MRSGVRDEGTGYVLSPYSSMGVIQKKRHATGRESLASIIWGKATHSTAADATNK